LTFLTVRSNIGGLSNGTDFETFIDSDSSGRSIGRSTLSTGLTGLSAGVNLVCVGVAINTSRSLKSCGHTSSTDLQAVSLGILALFSEGGGSRATGGAGLSASLCLVSVCGTQNAGGSRLSSGGTRSADLETQLYGISSLYSVGGCAFDAGSAFLSALLGLVCISRTINASNSLSSSGLTSYASFEAAFEHINSLFSERGVSFWAGCALMAALVNLVHIYCTFNTAWSLRCGGEARSTDLETLISVGGAGDSEGGGHRIVGARCALSTALCWLEGVLSTWATTWSVLITSLTGNTDLQALEDRCLGSCSKG